MAMVLLENERARQLNGYSRYWFTSMGRVYSEFKEGFLTQTVSTTGYYSIYPTPDYGVRKRIKVHRVIAKLFVKKKRGRHQVNHIDNNKLNNNYTNLEWVTPQENIQHYLILAGDNHKRSSKKSFLTKEIVTEMKRLIRDEGMTQTDVAKAFGCRREHVCNIMNYRRWKNVE
jgi:hypothetical protein